MKFEWDENKNISNIKKHGVTFQEAATAFEDRNALLLADPEHSDDEDRFVLLGLSAGLKLLVVCHCMRCADTVIRIISARKATTRETRQYNAF